MNQASSTFLAFEPALAPAEAPRAYRALDASGLIDATACNAGLSAIES